MARRRATVVVIPPAKKTVCVKIDEDVLREIDTIITKEYSNRSEFIREAIIYYIQVYKQYNQSIEEEKKQLVMGPES